MTPRHLVRDDADRTAVDAGEADYDALGSAGLHLEEVAVIDDFGDDVANVVALVAFERDDLAQLLVGLDRIVGIDDRGLLGVVLRQEAEQLLRDQDGLLVVVGNEVDDTASKIGRASCRERV